MVLVACVLGFCVGFLACAGKFCHYGQAGPCCLALDSALDDSVSGSWPEPGLTAKLPTGVSPLLSGRVLVLLVLEDPFIYYG